MFVPAGRFKQQEEKTKALEDKVKSHKRERVLIYDAAMKHVRTGGSFFTERLGSIGVQEPKGGRDKYITKNKFVYPPCATLRGFRLSSSLLHPLPTLSFCIGEEERGGRCQRGEAQVRKRAGQYAPRGRSGAEQDKVLCMGGRMLGRQETVSTTPFPASSLAQYPQLHFTLARLVS